MSELAKQITAKTTNRRSSEILPIQSVSFIESELRDSIVPPYLTEYSIHVKLEAKVNVKNDNDLVPAIANVRRLIIEHVFGEFRLPIRELSQAIYERDFRKADTILGVIDRRMFEEGL